MTSRLKANPAWPDWLAEPAESINRLCATITVRVHLQPSTVQRLQKLRDTLEEVGADEISDYALDARCTVLIPYDETAKPHPIGVAATVYSTGEASLSVNFDGIDTSLWLTEVLDLDSIATRVR